jgi:hypothetical protein
MSNNKEKLVFRLSELEPEPLDWLWPGWMAAGKPTLIDGDPSLGKSPGAMLSRPSGDSERQPGLAGAAKACKPRPPFVRELGGNVSIA